VETKDLCGLGCRSIIPYVHGRMGIVSKCAAQALAWLLVALDPASEF
jgi:hypothetical protein